MYAAVVHDVGLHHLVAVGGHNLCQRPAQQVVAHMAQVQRLVGVGRGIFYHDEGRLAVGLALAIVGGGVYAVEQSGPYCRAQDEIEETAHGVVVAHSIVVGLHPFAYLAGRLVGALA